MVLYRNLYRMLNINTTYHLRNKIRNRLARASIRRERRSLVTRRVTRHKTTQRVNTIYRRLRQRANLLTSNNRNYTNRSTNNMNLTNVVLRRSTTTRRSKINEITLFKIIKVNNITIINTRRREINTNTSTLLPTSTRTLLSTNRRINRRNALHTLATKETSLFIIRRSPSISTTFFFTTTLRGTP